MPGENSAELGTLIKAASDVRATRDGLAKDITTVESVVATLLATWAGAASQRFKTLMDQWEKDAHTIVTALEGFASQLETTHNIKRDAEDAVGTSFGPWQSLNN
jgi:WXG100 family type VII secretion target